MSERKAGWYWVKFSAHPDDEWVALKYTQALGFQIDRTTHVSENWFYMISPRTPTPDEMEGWQVVPKDVSQSMHSEVSETHGEHHAYVLGLVWPDALQAAPKPGDV